MATTTAIRKRGKPTQGSEGEAAIARSQCYQCLARAFAFPERSLYEALVDGRWLAEVREIVLGLPYRIGGSALSGWRVGGDYDDFQAEYIRLFEVGPGGGVPCPLHSGHYARDRLRVMEELVRFFNFFGLRLAPGKLPDHITVELEFMHYLAYKEGEALQGGGDFDSYRRAQRDFLDRHLANWLPRLAVAVRSQKPLRFFVSLIDLTERFLRADSAYLKQRLRPYGRLSGRAR